ncbi:hypothetical protein [Jeotgalibaca porci]|uniref:hypothetical protein n=1 Tax=Jeotgalibaca porci TaxID=1868793 RepID=UPI0035A0A7F0
MKVTFKNGMTATFENCNHYECTKDLIMLNEKFKKGEDGYEKSIATLNKEEVLIMEWIYKEEGK